MRRSARSHLRALGPPGRLLLGLACAAVPAFAAAWSLGAAGTAPATAVEPEPLSVDVTHVAPSQGEEVVRLAWGDGPNEAGLSAPAEGLTRGPEAFAVRPDGRMAILDSVNRRIIFVDRNGEVEGRTPIPLAQPRHLAAQPGTLYVLDADADHRIAILSWNGRQRGDVEVPPFSEPVTGLFADNGSLFVELAHDGVYPIPKNSGRPAAGGGSGQSNTGEDDPNAAEGTEDDPPAVEDEQDAEPMSPEELEGIAPKLPGRPVPGAEKAHVRGVFRRGGATVHFTGPQDTREWSVAFNPPVDQLISLDGLRGNEVVVGGRLTGPADPPPAGADTPEPLDRDLEDAVVPEQDRFAILRIDKGARGTRTSTPLLLESPVGVYVGAPYILGADGFVYQPVADEHFYRILRHEFTSRRGSAREEQR